MSLRKSPSRTPAFLAANRLNALKSTGPRTVCGKARSSLNSFKHGERACRLAETLTTAGYHSGASLHARVRRDAEMAFGVNDRNEARQAERLANMVVALARRAAGIRTKPECALFSVRLGPRVLSLFPICVLDRATRIGLVYWVQRKGYWDLPKLLEAMFRPGQTTVEPPLGRTLESQVRRRVFRMRRPGLWERIAYGLGDDGFPDRNRRPQPDLQHTLNQFGGRWWREELAARS